MKFHRYSVEKKITQVLFSFRKFQYDFLHAAPPCSPVKPLRDCHELTDNKGWLDVDPDTLLSKKFDNVFGMGDCLNTSNAKTGAAICKCCYRFIVLRCFFYFDFIQHAIHKIKQFSAILLWG